MTKPSKPEFATDGGALLADPGAPKRHAGFIVDEAIPAHWLNWLLKNNSDWIEYLANLNSEAEFLSQNYAWTGQHSIDQDVNYDAPKTFSMTVPLERGRPPDTSAPNVAFKNDVSRRSAWVIYPAGGRVVIPFELPSGAVVTGLTFGVNVAASSFLTCKLWGLPLSGAAVEMRAGSPSGTGDQVVTTTVSGSASQYIDRASNVYHLEIDDIPASNTTINWALVTYTMPGYRNG